MAPPPKKHYNSPQTYKAECGAGFTGSHTTTVPARFFYSYESKDAANELAMAEAQRVANANLICVPVTAPITTQPPPETTTTTEAPPPVTWYFWCYENETVEVPPDTRMRYGQGTAWIEKIMSGTVTANNETFGDPAVGVGKQLEAVIEKPVVVTTTTEAPVTTQEPVPGDRVDVYMSDYGITLSNADNSAANDPKIAQMVNDLNGPNKPKFRVHAPAGGGILHWGEESLPWASRILDLEFNGNGCKVQPHAKYAWEGAAFKFSRFYTRHTGAYVPAYRFKTVRKGEYRLTFETASDASKFFTGQRILPMGREMQRWGYPPNLFAYEWPIVKSVMPGAIDILSPLECSYNDKWQDTINYAGDEGLNVGKPRIWLLDVPQEDYYWSRYMKFTNFELLPNPQDASAWNLEHASVLFWEGEHVEYENVLLYREAPIWPTQSKTTIIRNTNVPYGIEIDKVCGKVHIVGGTSGGISGGTGCKELVVEAHKHPFCNTSALREKWIGNHFQDHFYSLLQAQPEGMHTFEIELKDNVFDSPDVQDGFVHRCGVRDMVIDGSNITTDGSFIYMPENDANKSRHAGWIPDVLFFNEDCSKVYKIVDVEWENNKYKLITTAPPGVFTTGQRWLWDLGHIKDSGGNVTRQTKRPVEASKEMRLKDTRGNISQQWGRPVLGPDDMRWAGNTVGLTGSRVTVWNQDNFRWHPGGGFRYIVMHGIIDLIEIDVTVPYRGNQCMLSLYKNDWGYAEQNRMLNLDIRLAGKRMLRAAGGVGIQPGEYFLPSKMNGFFTNITYNLGTDIQPLQETPKFRMAVTWRPLASQ